MDIYIPQEGAISHDPTLPEARITPVNENGDVSWSDISNERAIMHIDPWPGIEIGEYVHWFIMYKKCTGGWVGERKVVSTDSPINVLVRPGAGIKFDIFYAVFKSDGTEVGESSHRSYTIVE